MPELELRDLGERGRAVVVAPHPDDEVFAVGGLMTLLSQANYELEVVAVTDGEGSHPASSHITPERLRGVRECETRRAYAELGIRPRRFQLRLPDASVDAHADQLRKQLEFRLAGASFVFAPIETDGHPDHDVTGQVVQEVASKVGIAVWRFAVWARVFPERVTQGDPCSVTLPSDVLDKKGRAAAHYRSQLHALGPEPEDGPVLPAGFLEYFNEPRELLWPVN